jgi:hypothetical protein
MKSEFIGKYRDILLTIVGILLYLLIFCSHQHLVFGSELLTYQIGWWLPLLFLCVMRRALTGKSKTVFTIVLVPVVILSSTCGCLNIFRLLQSATLGRDVSRSVMNTYNVGGHVIVTYSLDAVGAGDSDSFGIEQVQTLCPGIYWKKQISAPSSTAPYVEVIDNSHIKFLVPVYAGSFESKKILYTIE